MDIQHVAGAPPGPHVRLRVLSPQFVPQRAHLGKIGAQPARVGQFVADGGSARCEVDSVETCGLVGDGDDTGENNSSCFNLYSRLCNTYELMNI